MHGVKRLFSWMIPRFDPARYNVALVSLRKKDLSEETLESMGIDITYLHKSKFDPATLTALLKVMDRLQTDILHLHGYGATTFGRLAGKMRGLPTILTGFGLLDSNVHAPDERLPVEYVETGIRTVRELLLALGELDA
jgi:acetylornithine deacetylase/succinyl-diaminopimelate desuccinylase-like protein